MDQFLKIAERVLVDRLISKHSPVTHKSKVGIFIFALAGVLFLIGLGMMLYASYVWFTMTYTPLIASMMLSAMLIATSILLCVCVCAVTAYQRRKIIQMRSDITSDISAVINLFEDEFDISQPLKNNPKTVTAIAAMCGFIAGDKFL